MFSHHAAAGRIGAHVLHSRHDSLITTAAARRAAATTLRLKLLAEIDPDGALERVEREKRLRHARAAHFQRLALASAKARRSRKGAVDGSA